MFRLPTAFIFFVFRHFNFLMRINTSEFENHKIVFFNIGCWWPIMRGF